MLVGRVLSGGKLETPLFIGKGRAGHSLLGVTTTWLSYLGAAKEHSLPQQGGEGSGRAELSQGVELCPAGSPGPSAAGQAHGDRCWGGFPCVCHAHGCDWSSSGQARGIPSTRAALSSKHSGGFIPLPPLQTPQATCVHTPHCAVTPRRGQGDGAAPPPLSFRCAPPSVIHLLILFDEPERMFQECFIPR